MKKNNVTIVSHESLVGFEEQVLKVKPFATSNLFLILQTIRPMNLKRRLATFFLTILTALMAVPLAANGGTYTAGDLVLFFFQENGSQTIYVNLGPAHTYRGNAAGPKDAAKNLNILNIKSALDEAYGTDWATKNDVYAGLAAVRTASTSTTAVAVNGDPSRTIYTSVANNLVDEPLGRIVPGNTDMTTIANGMISMNTRFPKNVDYAVVPSADSFIEGQNPFFTAETLDTAFGSLAGGVAQKSTAGSLGTFGEVSNVEFALDLHRILATNGGSGTINGGLDSEGNAVPIRTSTYEGTITINSNGIVGFSVIPPAPPAEITAAGSLAALSSTVGNPSSTTSFTVSGANMKESITITAPEGFEVSTLPTSDFSSSITVGAAGTINSTPIYVRLSASANIGTYSGDISLTSGSAGQTIATAESTVTEAVINPVISVSGSLTALSTTYGTASSTSNFTVSGTNMTGSVTVTPPAGFQVSTSPISGFDNSIMISVPDSGTLANTTIHVRLSPTANAGTYSGNISLTSTGAIEQTIAIADSKIDKATPTITTNPTASEILFGQKLEESRFNNDGVATFNGSVIDGTFTFEYPEMSPDVGTTRQRVIFTPSSQLNLNATPSFEIDVTVKNSVLPVINSPSNAYGTYLQNFSYQITALNNPTTYGAPNLPTGLSINNTGLITGNQTKSGNYTVTIRAINGSGNFDRTINIVIAKANPTINREPSASVITYGQKLLESYSLANGLDGSASVNGSFVFNDPNIIPDAGPKEQSVIFRPVDQENFNNLTNIGVTVRVNKASPSVLPPSASDITYGQKLSESKLNNGSATFIGGSVPGRFEFQEPDKRLNAGEFSNQSIIFIPSSNNNFNNATANVTVKVNKATPIITPPLASDIKKGESLENSILTNGSASFNDTKILGQFEFQYPTIIPAVGNSTQSVRFIPEDTNFREVIFPLSVNVVGPPSPIITTHPSSVTTLQGSNATFEVQASGESISYQWYKNGFEIIGAKNNILTIQKVSMEDAADYTVVIKSTNGSDPITSNAAKLNFTFALPDVSINENGTTTLNANVLGEGLKYQWMKNGVPILGQTSSVLTFDKVKPEQSGSYSVVLTDQNNKEHTSQNSKIDVNPLPVISSQPSNVSVYEGGNATMRVTTKGYSHSFQWNKDGMPIPGETKNTLSFSDVISRDQGDYTVTITNSAGTITSRSARLRVLSSISGNENSGNTAPSITTQPISQTITDGGNAVLSVSATGGSLSYQWLKNGSNITGANQASYTINSASIDNAGDYSVIVYNSISFISSNVAKITVNAPEIDVQQPVGSALTSGTSKISFGTARVGKAGISRTFTIKNIGNLNLNGITVAKAGSHSKEYTVTQLKRRMLAPGAAITFRVTFKAKAVGLREASIRIASNDRDENPFIINLAGQGAR
jgi:hypothetical protein